MLKIFNSNYEEIGSLNKNLVLNTQGKVKIRFNKKFIDLLDNNGNINVKIPNTIQKEDSVDKIKSNGIYFVDNTLYIYYEGTMVKVTGEVVQSDEEKETTVPSIVGLEFGLSEDLTVTGFPRYDQELNNELCSKHLEVEDTDEFNNVVPSIKWINLRFEGLEESVKQASNNSDSIEDLVAEINEIKENIKNSESWNDFRAIYNPE